MTVIVRDATNTPRTITDIIVRDGTNTPRTISEIRVRDSNNVSRVVYTTGGGGALSLSITPEEVTGYGSGTGTAQTEFATATPSGGVSPYTYEWALVSYTGPGTVSADNPTDDMSSFTLTGFTGLKSAIFQCTVTDDVSATATAQVTAIFSNGEPA